MLAGYRLRTVRDRNPFGTLRESATLKHHRDMTNSAEGALSAPEALKLRMQEMNRSKSALATSSGGPQS